MSQGYGQQNSFVPNNQSQKQRTGNPKRNFKPLIALVPLHKLGKKSEILGWEIPTATREGSRRQRKTKSRKEVTKTMNT